MFLRTFAGGDDSPGAVLKANIMSDLIHRSAANLSTDHLFGIDSLCDEVERNLVKRRAEPGDLDEVRDAVRSSSVKHIPKLADELDSDLLANELFVAFYTSETPTLNR